MKKRLVYLLSYLGLWVLFFIALKLLFLGYHYGETSQLGSFGILKVIGHGLKLDLSFSSYIAAIPFLLISISVFAPAQIIRSILKWYTIFAIILVSVLSVVDLELYKAWGFRLDATPITYLNTPQEMWASAGSSPILLLIIILFITIAVFAFAYIKLLHPILVGAKKPHPAFILLFLFLSASLIIPIRGGLQLAPINISDAYFSDNNYANQAAINVPWNFFNALSRKTYDKTNPYVFMDEVIARDILSEYFNVTNERSPTLLNTERPNVILIIWESFTAKATSTLGTIENVTPNFDALVDEGLLFTNFYAAGDRSDKGIVSIISGYPVQPTQSIIKLPVKSSKLPGLSQSFKNAGYSTSFYYGGELEFANIKAYLMNAGYDRLIGKEDFDPEDWNSKWGAHDHVVFNKVLKDLNQAPQPFFTTIFTLSSHEPFEVPIKTVIKGDDEESKFLNSLYYTDQSLGDFIANLKKEPWYDETLIVILADHGHRMPQSSRNYEKEKFHMPMLWLGGAVKPQDSTITKYSSQVDLAATLLGQLSIPADDYKWSRNILSPSYTPFAQYTFNNGFGHVTSSGYLAFDNINKQLIHQDSGTTAFEKELSKAYLQLSYQDFLDK